MNTRQRFACAGMLIALSACNSHEGTPRRPAAASPPPSPPPSPYTYQPCDNASNVAPALPTGVDALPGGIWYGSVTNELLKTTEPFTAIVAEDGRFRFQSSGHTVLFGSMATSGSEFSGDGLAYHGGSMWHDGSLSSELSIAGAIAERQTLGGTWVLASGDAGCFNFQYEAYVYERPSSLGLLSGTWTSYDAWAVPWTLSIDNEGNFDTLDPYSLCTTTGHFALIDDQSNLYEVPSASSDCDPARTYTGLAYLFDSYDGSSANNQIYISMDNGTTIFRMYMSR